MTLDEVTRRSRFESMILRTASVPNPAIFYARRENECVDVGDNNPFYGDYVILPHPDVTLTEFFSSA